MEAQNALEKQQLPNPATLNHAQLALQVTFHDCRFFREFHIVIIHNMKGCCNEIEVRQSSGCNPCGAVTAQPQIFTSYTINQDNIEGKAYYTSQDGRYALVYTNSNSGLWLIQHVQQM